ncbi:c-type cytochrome [Thioalkalivibrio sp. HK1]|uniref:c-type cytochrome n=1 Tax=Thioalkalivibrio sp. HK1 TaxID=1469245 RepID=UPI001E5FA05A|nr:cytochrome c [Thioalkalivibrio sp. HK1]
MMASQHSTRAASIALIVGLVFGACGASAQERVAGDDEAEKVMEMRSQTMKGLGRSMRTLRDFARGRKDAEEAVMAASDIEKASTEIPSLFPIGTGLDEFLDSEAKEVIWEEWDAFTAASQQLTEKAAAMVAAIESADQGRIREAFGDLGRNGCGGCHNRFREERD